MPGCTPEPTGHRNPLGRSDFPLIANADLHYMLDRWFARAVQLLL